MTYTAYFLATGIAIFHGYIISKKRLTRRKYIQILCLVGILFVSLVLLGRKGEFISVILSLLMMWGITYSIKKGRVGKGGFLMLVWMIPILAIIIYFYFPKLLTISEKDKILPAEEFSYGNGGGNCSLSILYLEEDWVHTLGLFLKLGGLQGQEQLLKVRILYIYIFCVNLELLDLHC